MRLHRLSVRSFRGTRERSIAFAERGVTVVEGPNEAGKSSLVEALDLLFAFQAHSKARAVRRVQPAGQDVASEVSAELTCGPYRLTYGKRFNREPATTLAVHAPEREQLAGAQAHERVSAILGEHLDEALWRALRIIQDAPLSQPDLAEQSSLAAALDAAAGARVGGEREAALFDRVRAEFERYHTPGGQPAKERRALADAEAAAAAECADAEAALQAVEDDVARCADLARALADLAPLRADAQARAERAQAAWRALEHRQLDVDRLALAADRAAGERDRALEVLADRRTLADRHRSAERQLADARAALERRGPALEAASRELDEVTAGVERLRAALRTTRADCRIREREAEALRDVEALAHLDERIARLEAAEAQAAEAAAVLAGPVVDDATLQALEDALADVHRAQAVAETEAPTVTVRRLAPVALTVDGDAVTDDQGIERRALSTTVRIGDLAEVRVTAGRDAHERFERVRAAERALDDLLAGCGVETLAAARCVHRRRAEATAALARADRTRADLLGDESLPALRETGRRLRARLERAGHDRAADLERAAADPDGAPVLQARFERVRAAAEAARAHVARRESELATAEAALRDAADRRASLLAATATLRARAQACEEALADARRALEEARNACADEGLEAAAARAEHAARAAQQTYEDARSRLDADDPDGAHAAWVEATGVLDRLAKEQRALEDDLRDTRARLHVRAEEGLHDRVADAQRRLTELSRERARVEARASAARLLHDELASRRADATRAYAAPLRDKLESLGRIVYGEGFAVEVASDLRIVRRTLRGVTLDYEDLSTGAREQLGLLTRLAVAALVARDGGVPLIIDDALGSSDPARLARLGAALRVGARDAQVIVLTCVPERYRTVGDAAVVRLT